uniref:Uncharacterized protein LOC104220529 n=1 Tax=Nicotiana sylvestris TaxID=4096 RepID=A0A1U7W509_NICSY|nr:PREDICTED: uncharacterized protein LOC104220529 [Nicotiana sylvestris]
MLTSSGALVMVKTSTIGLLGKKLCFLNNESGIGIRGMDDISNTLTIKRWWHFRVSNSMWADFLKAKYCPRVHPVIKKWYSGNSQAWKHLLWDRDKCEKLITWNINGGNCNFWWDNWTELGPLAHICSSYINTSNTKKKVNDFMSTNGWDAQRLYNTLSSHIALHIMRIQLVQENKNDYAIWNATEDGHFINGFAWNIIRDHRTINVTINMVWHKLIPFKQSFMCWKIFLGRIPIRQTITRLDSQDTEVCSCCPTPVIETLQHVFVDGRAAEYVWKAMGNPLGIIYQQLPIRGLLNRWWNIKARNIVHKLILQALSVIICWEIWKSWAACKYGDNNSFYLYRMVTQCVWNIKEVLQNASPTLDTTGTWSNLCKLVEKLKLVVICTSVHWIKPAPGKAGIEGIVRNSNGDFIFAFSIPVQASSSSQTEVIAARFGVEWCTQHGYSHLHVEIDSLIFTNILTNQSTNNLKLQHIINGTTTMLDNTVSCISHCLTEANQIADLLAKLASTSGNRTLYHSHNNFPKEAKGLIQLDKWQIPTFRRRYEKCNFFVS